MRPRSPEPEEVKGRLGTRSFEEAALSAESPGLGRVAGVEVAERDVTWPESFPMTIGCLLRLTAVLFPAGPVCFALGFKVLTID